MKTIITIIVSGILGVCIFTGCTVLPVIAGALDPSTPSQDWAHKAHLAKLMKHPKQQLLTKDEKVKAAIAICALKHLDKHKNNQIFKEKAKAFCSLKQNDKIYFYDWCMECAGSVRQKGTSYLLVRDGKALESIKIETRRDRELQQSFPIIERLH